MISESKRLYESIGSVYCPSIKDNVLFNNYGWRHLRFDGHGHKRNEQDIRRRLHLFKYALEVVKNCKEVIETEERFIKINGLLRKAEFIEISYDCKTPKGKIRFNVILRKFEVGPTHFHSIRTKKAR